MGPCLVRDVLKIIHGTLQPGEAIREHCGLCSAWLNLTLSPEEKEAYLRNLAP